MKSYTVECTVSFQFLSEIEDAAVLAVAYNHFMRKKVSEIASRGADGVIDIKAYVAATRIFDENGDYITEC